MRCEVNIAGREEDCGRRITYVPCGQPAHWHVEQHGTGGGYDACERHTMEALLDGVDEVYADIDGEPVCLDEDGEIARVA